MKKIKKTDQQNSILFLNNWPIYNRTIHIHETDKNGVVHFSNYFKIAEEALYSGLKRLGVLLENSEYTITMVNTLADYYLPIQFTDHINIIITDIKIEQEKLNFFFNFNDSDHNSLAKIQLTFILTDKKNKKTILIPEHLKVKLKQAAINKSVIDAETTTLIYT